MVKLVSVNNGPLASNLIHVIGLKKTRDDGSTIVSDTITIGREGTTTNIENLVTSKIGYGPSNTLSIAGNVNVSSGGPVTVLSFTTINVAGAFSRIAFGGGKFVQYGYLGKLYYSTNGINWTLGTYPTIDYGARVLLYTGDRFLFFGETGTTPLLGSMDGITWNTTQYITTSPLGQVSRGAAGNNIAILAQWNTGNISVSTDNTGRTWTNISLAGTLIYQVGFGKMSSGTNPNVFLLVGPNVIKRADKAVPNAQGDWLNPTNTPLGNWWYIGFGNDTFMVTSSDANGLLTIGTNGGLDWSTPISFGISLKQPVHFQGYWYIGSDSGFMMVSKNNGITWEKKYGIDIETFASGNNLLVGINDVTGEANNKTSVIGLKTKREDGSLITSDTITIGREGTTTTFDSDKLNIKGVIEFPYKTSNTENGLRFRMSQEYGNSGKDLLKLQGTSFLDTIENPHAVYYGTNLVANFTNGFNSLGMPTGPVDGVYTFSTDGQYGSYGFLNTNFIVGKGITYKIIFTVRADTDNTTINLTYNGSNNTYFNNISKTEYKTYTGYFIATTSGMAVISVSGTGNVRRTIKYSFFSIEPLYGATLNHSMYVGGGLTIPSGYVGIGTTSPQYPLHVVGDIYTPSKSPMYEYTYFEQYNGLLNGTFNVIAFISLATTGRVLSFGGFYAASDRRIKSNIVDIDDERALRDLRLLKPKTYTYTDVLQKGSTPVYGFIAQEVKEVLNYASSPITETVPNVYELATFSGDMLTLVFNTADLSRDASGALFPRLKLKTRDGKDEFVNILEILDEHTLRVNTDLTNWGGQLVGDQIVPGNRIFVYGQEVNDFHTLNKDAIWTVATAALQEVDRQLQAEKQKTALMQTALDALLERVNALEQKTSV